MESSDDDDDSDEDGGARAKLGDKLFDDKDDGKNTFEDAKEAAGMNMMDPVLMK